MSGLFFIILSLLIIGNVVPKMLCNDKKHIWSPVVFVSVYLSYYTLLPYVKGVETVTEQEASLLLLATILFYLSFTVAFYCLIPKISFRKYNEFFNRNNSFKIAILLFGIAFLGYGIYNGFSLTIVSTAATKNMEFSKDAAYGHTEMYVVHLISLFAFSCSLLYAAKQKFSVLFFILFGLSLIIYVIGGFRYRILVLLVSVFTVRYLYPCPKKINYYVILPIIAVTYLSMGVMESTRMYGRGLNEKALDKITRSGKIKDASENMNVYEFSAKCMNRYDINNVIGLEPLKTALSMPIPRSVFPSKPKGDYLRKANVSVYGTVSRGNAFLCITEAYVSFWWLGVVVYGFFLGWLSKVFWNNYLNNLSSIGAVVLLGLYNGILYVFISRGYMAQDLTLFVYYILVPIWAVLLCNKIGLFRNQEL